MKFNLQKQPSIGVLRKRCSENMQQLYSSRSVISVKLQTNFIEIALRHGCSPVNLLHIFEIALFKNTSGRLLLNFIGRQIFIYYFPSCLNIL